jgi:hypothetical protein
VNESGREPALAGSRPRGTENRGNGYRPDVEVAAGIMILAFAVLSLAVVLVVFVWAARKDGQEDRALQRRLGIRRRTRIGR